MIPGITFGSSKGLKNKVVKVTLSDEPDRARGKDPTTSSEIYDTMVPKIDPKFITKKVKITDTPKATTSARIDVLYVGGLDEIRDLKPCDILEEMNLGSHTVFKQSNDSIAVREKNGHCKFYIHVNDKWINRFNHKEEL